MWLYADLNPNIAIANVLSLAAELNETPAFLGIDVETYGAAASIPSEATVRAAIDACGGTPPCIYSSPSMWARIGSPSMPGVRGWGATYINAEPVDLSGAPQFGDLQMIAWQWTSSPLDQSLFLI